MRKLTLYSNGCALCIQVKSELERSGREFEVVSAKDEVAKFLFDHGHREMPVLSDGVLEVSGYDCISSLRGGEI